MNDCTPKNLLEEFTHLPGLASVEELIKISFSSEVPQLSEIPTYLFGLGGKRLRPTIALLSGYALGADHENGKLITLAAGIELIHLASLLHDDVIDLSPLRRHKPSAFAKYGSSLSILAGDFLFVRAFGLCAKLDQFIIGKTEEACVALTEGEVLESSGSFTSETALEIAAKKTAALFALGAEGGAYLAGCSEATAIAMRHFGQNLGIAFQIVDDLLDVTQTSTKLGKEPGSDLRERKPSLVNALWLKDGSSLAREWFGEGDCPIAKLDQALAQIRESGVLSACQDLCTSHISNARSALMLASAKTKPNQWLSQLEALLKLVAERDF